MIMLTGQEYDDLVLIYSKSDTVYTNLQTFISPNVIARELCFWGLTAL